MRSLLLIAIASILSFWLGAFSQEILVRQDRALMRANLSACGYTPHPIADVAWELVRIGAVPPMTAAYFSARVTSKNNHNDLKACMTPKYGG